MRLMEFGDSQMYAAYAYVRIEITLQNVIILIYLG